MKKKTCNLRMIGYELRNINGNLMTHFFAFVFPNILSLLLSKTITGDVPKEMQQEIITGIMLSASLIIPLSTMLLGYGAIYSNEVEREIPLRMRLFGYPESCLITAKIAAHLIFMTIAFVVFGVFQMLTLDIARPSAKSMLTLLVSLYLIGVIFLVISHAISNIFRKFSVTFGVEMSLYFMIMILSGMMGIQTEQLPEVLQKAARLLPMTYISNDFAAFWQSGTYNIMPLLQSFLFLGAVCGILLLYSVSKNRRAIR